jgi:cobalt-zinc-cadmium efflux system outer membrane protein
MKTAFLMFLFSSFSFAITENDVAISVLTHFPLIQEAELKAKASLGEVTSAEGAFDHKLSFKTRNRFEEKYENQYFETVLERQTSLGGVSLIAGHRQGTGLFPLYDGKYSTSGAGEIFAGLSVPVLRNFRTDQFRTNLLIKQIERNQAELELKLKKMIYLHKAMSLYYKWILETQKLKISKSILELAKTRHYMIEKKHKSGDIEKLKVTDNQRAIDKRSGYLIKSQIELEKVSAELSIFLRDKTGGPLAIPIESNPEFVLGKDEPNIILSDVSRNPQLEILELEKNKFKAEANFYDQSKLPGLDLQLLGARELSGNDPYDPERLQVGLKFDFPLENRKAEGKSVAYNYKVMALQKNQQYLKTKLIQQLNFFMNARTNSKLQWKVINEEYDGTQKMASAEKQRWLQGDSDLFVVNLREQDVADVDIRRWTTLYDYHQYHLDALLFSGEIINSFQ